MRELSEGLNHEGSYHAGFHESGSGVTGYVEPRCVVVVLNKQIKAVAISMRRPQSRADSGKLQETCSYIPYGPFPRTLCALGRPCSSTGLSSFLVHHILYYQFATPCTNEVHME